jgi:hypothetical protein
MDDLKNLEFERLERKFEEFLEEVPKPIGFAQKKEYSDILVKAYLFLEEIKTYVEKPS